MGSVSEIGEVQMNILQSEKAIRYRLVREVTYKETVVFNLVPVISCFRGVAIV